MRDPQVIVVWNHRIRDQQNIGGAPVWAWSDADPARHIAGSRTICSDAVGGDCVVWYETYRADGDTLRSRPWAVVRARQFRSGRVEVAIGCGAISHHRTVEAAVKAAAAMLRHDNAARAAAARAATN